MLGKIPMRRCTGCGEMKEKKSLIRIVRTPEGEVLPDISGRANGRGVYLCRDVKCLQAARKKKALARGLETAVSEEVFGQLEKLLADQI